MLDRIRTAITSNPWRSATVGLAVALVVVGAIALLGSGGEEAGEADVTTTTLAAGSTTAVPGPTTTVSTGPEAEPEGSVDGGLFAIKIDNTRQARPQWGLSEATILVEYFVEGSISRFTAVVPDGVTGLMGPIRSLRPVDADLLPALTRSVVSTGGRPWVVGDVEAAGIQNIQAVFSSMFVSVGNADPYDTFVDVEILRQILPDTTPRVLGLPHGDLPAPTAEASELFLPFEGAVVRYQDDLGYLHERADEPFLVFDTSGANATQLSEDIVVVLHAAERPAGYVDVNGVPVVTYDIVGGGDLLVLAEGSVFAGTWRRDAREDGFEFFDTSGNSFGLPDGSVYMAIVPRDSQVSYR